MKPWLKNVILFLTGFLLGGAAVGFGIHHCVEKYRMHGSDPEALLDRLDSKLDLTEMQEQKLSAILQEKSAKRDALRKEGRAKFEALKADYEKNLRKILTPSQLEKWEAWKAARSDDKGVTCGPSPWKSCGPDGTPEVSLKK